jgi:GGDEF domain-containing protein
MEKKRRSFLYEIPIFYLLLFALQRGLFPELFAFHQVNPNPCWLGILLFALRYGLAAGLLSGLASAAFYLAGFRLAGELFHFEDLDFYLQPGLFVVLGAGIGAAADAFLHRIADLDSRIADLDGRNQGLVRQIRSQQEALRAVEQQVVSQMSSLVTLYHGARELGSVDKAALFKGVLDFFTQALCATKTSLYIREDERWVLKDQRGWQDSDVFPKALDFTQGLIGRAGSEKKVVSLRDWLADPAQEGHEERWSRVDAIMAGPLQAPSGEVEAVFAVQAMPFFRFNSAAVNLLTLLLDWGDEALAKCLHFEELRSRSILDEDYGVYNEGYFRSRVRQEFARSKRHALPFSLLLLSPGKMAGVPVDRQVTALKVLARMLRETVREIDVVTRTPFDDWPFAVLMMTATADQAQVLVDRIAANHKKLDLPPGLKVTVGSYRSGMEDADALVGQAKTGSL